MTEYLTGRRDNAIGICQMCWEMLASVLSIIMNFGQGISIKGFYP